MKQHTPTCAVITGASQGLGKAFAEECAARGMDLLLAALPDTGLPDLARLLRRAHGVRVETLELDLAGVEAPALLTRALRAAGLAPDLLVNNAGVGYTSRFAESSPGQNEATIQLNVAALVRITQSVLPALREARRAWILNVASLGAFFPMPSMPVYSSTKGFILEFSLLLRSELRREGISVSVLCPNGIRTNRGARELINRQGWAGRLTCQYPDEVARAGLDGLLRGTGIVVPGAVNRLLMRVRPLVPRGLFMGLISRRWGTASGRPRPPARAVRTAAEPAL